MFSTRVVATSVSSVKVLLRRVHTMLHDTTQLRYAAKCECSGVASVCYSMPHGMMSVSSKDCQLVPSNLQYVAKPRSTMWHYVDTPINNAADCVASGRQRQLGRAFPNFFIQHLFRVSGDVHSMLMLQNVELVHPHIT